MPHRTLSLKPGDGIHSAQMHANDAIWVHLRPVDTGMSASAPSRGQRTCIRAQSRPG